MALRNTDCEVWFGSSWKKKLSKSGELPISAHSVPLAPGDTLKPWIALLPDGERQTGRVPGVMKIQWPPDAEMKPQLLTCRLPPSFQFSVAELTGMEGMRLGQPHRGQKRKGGQHRSENTEREAQVRSWRLGNGTFMLLDGS